jgi:cytoskeleton protein RodZ
MDQPRTQEGNQTTAKDGFGVHLRREREMRGVTLEEISSATRIGTRFLDALETEHWDRLPGGVFNRGFVRSTAQFLGLDPEAMLAEYTIATTDSARPAAPVLIHSQSSWTPKTANAPRDRRWVPGVVIVVIAAVAVAGWFGWRHVRNVRRARADAAALAATSGATTGAAADSTSPAPDASSPAATATPDTPDATSQSTQVGASQPATSDSSSAPGGGPASAAASAPDGASDTAAVSAEANTPGAAPVATAPATAPVSAPTSTSKPLVLKIEVGRATSVKVSIDGHKTFQGKIPAGGSRVFHANDVFFVTAHDAGGVLLELNGQTLPPLGPPGHSANIRLTRESLKSQDGTNH